MWDQSTFDLYRRVTCPVKLIVAEPQTSGEARREFFALRLEGIVRIQEICPRLELVRMPDTIHDIPFQRPRELAEEIVAYAPPQA